MAQSPQILGIIGVGAIASAIVEGLSSAEDGPSILLSPRNARVAADLVHRFEAVEVAESNEAVLARATMVILSLRPQEAPAILEGLRFAEGQAIISVMAGIRCDSLRRLVSPAHDISRAIPLSPVAHRGGLTPIYPTTRAAKAIFGALGGTIDLADEAAFDAFSAVSGTVAAHLAYLEAISAWLADRGVPNDAARRFVASIYVGLDHGLRVDTPDFARMARDHTTPGGLNEQFRRHLTEAGLYDKVKDGLDQILARLMPSGAS